MKLLQEVLQRKLRLPKLLLQLDRLDLVELLLRLLDKGDDVTHPEDAGSNTVRVERFQGIQFLTDPDELDRRLNYCADRKRCAAAAVAVELREDDPVEVQAIMEGLCRVHGILARHRVHDKQNLVGGGLLLDRGDFLHHRFIDMQAPCRIDDDRITDVFAGEVDGVRCDLHGPRFPVHVDRYPQLFPQHHQLVDGRGAIDVRCNQQRVTPLPLQKIRQLGGEGGFTRTLQARHEDHRRGCIRGPDFRFRLTEQPDHLIMDDLDDELSRCDAIQDFLADGSRLDLLDEVLRDLVVDIGI